MKRILLILTAIAALTLSCEKPEPGPDTDGKARPGYKELLEAYDAGKVFKEVQASAEVNIVVFEDGSKINVPVSSFMIHDHTKTPAPTVEVETGMQWWSVGGQMTGIKALHSALSKYDAEPVYVYYDANTLYMYVSNRAFLKFASNRLTPEDELARRQNIPVIEIDSGGKGI